MTSKTSTSTRRKPATSDVIGTSVMAAIGAFALVMGLGYGVFEEDGQVGPGFLPLVTGGFILVASLAEVTRMYLAPAERKGSLLTGAEVAEREAKEAMERLAQQSEERDTFGRTSRERNKALVKIFGIMFIALLLIPVVGLLLSLTAMVLTIVLWVERKPPVRSLLATAGAFVAVYLIFVQTLGVPMPQGMFGLI